MTARDARAYYLKAKTRETRENANVFKHFEVFQAVNETEFGFRKRKTLAVLLSAHSIQKLGRHCERSQPSGTKRRQCSRDCGSSISKLQI